MHCIKEPQCLSPIGIIQILSQAGCSCRRELPAHAIDAGAMTTTNKLLCDEECIANLDGLQTEETKTGLKYKDIVVGKGPSPPTGYQVYKHLSEAKAPAP